MTGLNENQRQAATSALEEARDQGKTITVFPIVDGDELFFQDGLRVYALHLESGVPLPGWAQTYAGNRQGQGGRRGRVGNGGHWGNLQQ